MPRGPKKSSASQHNNRHENGIVAPGRRIVKQRSNGQLKESGVDGVAGGGNVNGSITKNQADSPSSDGSSRAGTPPASASPLGAVPSLVPEPQPGPTGPLQSNGRLTSAYSAKARSPSSPPMPVDGRSGGGGGGAGAGAGGGYGGGSGVGSGEEVAASGARPSESSMRRSDSNVGRQTSTAQEAGMFHTAGTVLRSFPITDTLAVLCFLLSLPPALHSVINAVFTITTFVPPTGTFASLPTWSDLISSYSPNTPSLMVTALIDFAAMSLWIWLPQFMQAAAIDLAQAVVATTLGGGYSNKPGSSDNTLLCVLFTLLTHGLSRYAWPHKHRLLHMFYPSEIERWPPQNGTVLEEARPLALDYPVGYDRSWADTIKVFLAIHILCQGLTKMVRRNLSSSRTQQTISAFSGRGGDAEVIGNGPLSASDLADGGGGGGGGTGISSSNSSNNNNNNNSTNNVANHHPPQLRSRESLANLRDSNRDRISSGKRRRKQGNYTRSQQPLWAAFAASKANIFQSFAESKAGNDGKGAGATNGDSLGDAPFESCKSSIWLTSIESNSVFFETGVMDTSPKPRSDAESEDEKPTPFYVTVNGARWTSLKMQEVPTMEKPAGCWVGEIYGLSPACSYQISFKSHHGSSGPVLHHEAIATPASSTQADKSVAATASPNPILRPSSPASPIATLETSTAEYESSNVSLREDIRKAKKDNRANQQNLRREIETLKDRLQKQANNVQNLQAKQSKENQHIRQAEDAISTMAEELDTWKEIPDDEMDEYRARKVEFEDTRNAHRHAKNELVRTKESHTRNLNTLTGELNSIKQKNERLQTRVTRLTTQHTKLTTPEPPTGPAASTIPTGPAGMGPLRSGSGSGSGSGTPMTRAQQRQERKRNWDDQIEGRERMLHNIIMSYNAGNNQIKILQAQMEAAAAAQAEAMSPPPLPSLLHQQQQQQQQQQPARPITPEGDLPGTVPVPPSSTNNTHPLFDLPSRETFGTPDRFAGAGGIPSKPFDPLTPSSASLHKTNSTGGHGKTKTQNSSFSAVRPRSTSIMSGNTIYQDVDDGSGNTDVTSYDPWASSHAIGQFKRRSGGSGLAREGSNGGSSGSGSPLVAGSALGNGNSSSSSAFGRFGGIVGGGGGSSSNNFNSDSTPWHLA